jgi:hypothetical protein
MKRSCWSRLAVGHAPGALVLQLFMGDKQRHSQPDKRSSCIHVCKQAAVCWHRPQQLLPCGHTQVRAAVATKLAFKEREGEAATATPSSRAFTGAVHITYNVNPTFTSYRAMAALLRYAADTWPYVTSVTLDIHYECPELTE